MILLGSVNFYIYYTLYQTRTSRYKERPSSLQCDTIAGLDDITKEYVILSTGQSPSHV